MKAIKEGLFRVANGSEEPEESTDDASVETEASDSLSKQLEDEGFTRAAHMKGSNQGLTICLNRLYQEYKAEVKNDEVAQEESRQPIRDNIEELKGTIERLKKRIEAIRDDKIPRAKERIESLRDEIRDIKQNPEQIIGDAPGRASFLVGVAILVCLSIYLFIFYSSASYSAFFKQFTPEEIGVANSIFDAQALPKAYSHGITELILILMMPFVFLGLGFLVHKFQQGEGVARYFKVGMLILVTFVFDGILAFEITEKIYQLEQISGFQSGPEYTIAMASEDPKFWLIIFAGFVVYLIWGFVFDFVIDEHERLDAVAMAIKSRQEKIDQAKADIHEMRDEITEIKEEKTKRETKLTKLKNTLNVTVFVPKEFERRISSFMVGWVHWLKANRHADSAVREANDISERFLDNVLSGRRPEISVELS